MKKRFLILFVFIAIAQFSIAQYAPSGFGLGTAATRLGTNTDLNSIISNGWYDVYDPLNGVPSLLSYTNKWHNIFQLCSADPGYITQLAFDMTTWKSGMYMRTKTGNNWNSWKTFIMANESGKVGIGTTDPQYSLDVNGTSGFRNTLKMLDGSVLVFGPANMTQTTNRLRMVLWNNLHAYIDYGENLYFRTTDPNVSTLTLFGDGTMGVGFGTTYETGNYPTKSYKLAVNGAMVAEKVVVKLRANWPDFVFAENHKMRSLSEIESYIKIYKHLPDVPTAKEVNEKGIDVGEMNVILLKKIEELTILMIEQNKSIEALKAKINGLQNN